MRFILSALFSEALGQLVKAKRSKSGRNCSGELFQEKWEEPRETSLSKPFPNSSVNDGS